ncbi:MAG: hypothetical protein ACRC7S_09825 [Cetobacterium sp.]
MKKTDSFNPENIIITIGGVKVKPYVMKKYYNISLIQTGGVNYEYIYTTRRCKGER